MIEKWIRVYRSPRWDVVYNIRTFVWRVKRYTRGGWHATCEFVANGLSWKRNVAIPEALWWEVMTQARQQTWRREEVDEAAQTPQTQETQEAARIDIGDLVDYALPSAPEVQAAPMPRLNRQTVRSMLAEQEAARNTAPEPDAPETISDNVVRTQLNNHLRDLIPSFADQWSRVYNATPTRPGLLQRDPRE